MMKNIRFLVLLPIILSIFLRLNVINLPVPDVWEKSEKKIEGPQAIQVSGKYIIGLDTDRVLKKIDENSNDPDQFVRVLSFIYNQLSWLGLTIEETVFYLPVIVFSLSVITVFFIARKLSNIFGGFISALVLSVHPYLLEKTFAGFINTYSFNTFLSILVIYLILLMMDAEERRYLTPIVLALVIYLLHFFWEGWYIFFIVSIVSVISGIIFDRYKYRIRGINKSINITNLGIYLISVIAVIYISPPVGYDFFDNRIELYGGIYLYILSGISVLVVLYSNPKYVMLFVVALTLIPKDYIFVVLQSILIGFLSGTILIYIDRYIKPNNYVRSLLFSVIAILIVYPMLLQKRVGLPLLDDRWYADTSDIYWDYCYTGEITKEKEWVSVYDDNGIKRILDVHRCNEEKVIETAILNGS